MTYIPYIHTLDIYVPLFLIGMHSRVPGFFTIFFLWFPAFLFLRKKCIEVWGSGCPFILSVVVRVFLYSGEFQKEKITPPKKQKSGVENR